MNQYLEKSPVWLFVPNLIGYARVLLALWAFVYVFDEVQYPKFFFLYFVSYILDACDGVAARLLKQTSRFGAVLDMVTDRICTAGLLAALAHLYAHTGYHMVFIVLLMLDVGAHWVQMYSTLATGAASHKSLSGEFSLVRLYYNAYTLFTICLFNETCLAMLFILGHAMGKSAYAMVPYPFNISVPELKMGSFIVPAHSLYMTIAAITAPVAVLKQIISVLQLITAARRIVAIDESARGAVIVDAPARISTGVVRRTASPASRAASPGPKKRRGL